MFCGYKKRKLDDSPSFNYTEYTILNLNDDCLYEIFSYLTFRSLWRVGATCVRLHHVAQQLYSGYYANLDVSQDLNYHPKAAEAMIQEIGSHVKIAYCPTCHMDSDCVPKGQLLKAIQLVLKYCINLSELNFFFSSVHCFSDDEIQKMFKSPIFQNLQSVKLEGYLIDIPVEILASMKNLKKLNISTHNNIESSEFLKIRNLESLRLYLPEPLGYNICSAIFDNNLQLKKLYLKKVHDRFLNLICDKLIYLEDLDFWYDSSIISDRTLMRIAELKNLTHFKPDWPQCLLEKLADTDMLESLCYNKNLGESVTKFTKLKHLAMSFGDDIILNSLKSQSTLEYLDIRRNKSITANGLVKFIEGAKNLKRLTMHHCDEAFDESLLHRINDQFVKFHHGKLAIDCDFEVNNYQKYRNLIVESTYDPDALSGFSYSDSDSDF